MKVEHGYNFVQLKQKHLSGKYFHFILKTESESPFRNTTTKIVFGRRRKAFRMYCKVRDFLVCLVCFHALASQNVYFCVVGQAAYSFVSVCSNRGHYSSEEFRFMCFTMCLGDAHSLLFSLLFKNEFENEQPS